MNVQHTYTDLPSVEWIANDLDGWVAENQSQNADLSLDLREEGSATG